MRKLILLLLLCSGCATTQQAMERANRDYIDHSVDELVRRFGPPCGHYQLNDGQQVYTWSLGSAAFNMPYTTTTNGSVNSFGQYHGSSYTTGGGVVNICCDIQVITTSDGIITGISSLRDTWGVWTTSRCAEIFK
jgi:hypothetical protein